MRSAPTTRCCGAGCPPTSPGGRSPPSPPTRPWAPTCRVGPSSPGGRPPITCSASGTPPGGAQGLTDALVTRLASLGGELRCGARVARIEAPGGRVRAVVTEAGERIEATAVITAIDPQVALLQLLDPPLAGAAGADLAAARRGNVVQALVHVATDRLPPYPGCRPGDWNGLQSFVDRLDDLAAAWATSEAGELPDVLPLYAFTTSAIDPSLAPAGHHTVYLACPAAPARVEGGWPARQEEFVERALEDGRGPGARLPVEHRRRPRPHPRRHGARGLGGRPPDAPRPRPRPARALPPHPPPGRPPHTRGRAVRVGGGDEPDRRHRRHAGTGSGAGSPGRPVVSSGLPDAPCLMQTSSRGESLRPTPARARRWSWARPCSAATVLPEAVVQVPAAMCNRHGLIAGATGTGKTKTLQLMAEQLSAMGVPVFAADVKGDLSGLSRPGEVSDRVTSRVDEMELEWSPAGLPGDLPVARRPRPGGAGAGRGVGLRAPAAGQGDGRQRDPVVVAHPRLPLRRRQRAWPSSTWPTCGRSSSTW